MSTREELEFQLTLLETAKKRYEQTLHDMSNFFNMSQSEQYNIKLNAETTIAGYEKDIIETKEKLKKLALDELKKDLLETGVLDQQKIEDTVAIHGIEKIELSPEAKEMQKHQTKVNSIFDKHLKSRHYDVQ